MSSAPMPTLTIVVPALNEEESLPLLIEEVERKVLAAGVEAELIIVDDGSTDATPEVLRRLKADRPWLRSIRFDERSGQSAAMGAGIAAARGEHIATLDADLQNDPGDLVTMLHRMTQEGAALVQGDRSRVRQDAAVRKVGSWVGRKCRLWVVGDAVRDTGCSARVMAAPYAKRLPLQFRGMHRFIPANIAMMGGRVVEMDVNHRARAAGVPKYGLGVLSRAFVGLGDLLAMRWMIHRHRAPEPREHP